MITLSEPTMALHSCDVPGYKYQMNTTETLASGASVSTLVGKIAVAVFHAPENYIKNLVINCHGSPGKLFIGGDGNTPMDKSSMGQLKSLEFRIGNLWIVACEVGADKDSTDEHDGDVFCTALAKTLHCNVIAAVKNQSVNSFFENTRHPKNCIDRFEGKVYKYSSDGKKKRYFPALSIH